ncbi:uncharacterized protein N7484_010970 [Penicillium longicatenatum]|uniref:uncharacterized protein n=1 Tax=Penicillium longicatenatum TaxID=1561947 RepID=UPI00254781DC|nr:uncharacterized protein N7484_010970 [Penicillium longicatenatum]KAJ5630870.1 hypothetical protein N7484_010970 [Penicillium longicatenatum]
MSLQYDSEFLKQAGPVLQQLAQFQKPALHDVATRRAMTASMTSALPPIPDDMERILHHVPSEDGYEVNVYHFRKRHQPEAGGDPAILHIHGGGYISLSAEQCSVPHIRSVSSTGVQVLTVDYRLAPENPYPKPLNDCWAVLKWLHANASQLSIDPARIAVMGESAGGGLAAALTLLARDTALSPPIAKQILVYPMIDDRTNINHAGQLVFWDEVDNKTGWTAYLGSNAGTENISSYAAPSRVESVEGLPPLYMDCGQLDMFVHEGLYYVHRFVAANIPTEYHLYPGLPHGFEAMAPSISSTKKAIANRERAMTSF